MVRFVKLGAFVAMLLLSVACGSDEDKKGSEAGASTSKGETGDPSSIDGSGSGGNNYTTTTGQNGNGNNIAPPTELASGLSFVDSDNTFNELQGDLTITPAADESNIDSYTLYWGSGATTKLDGTALQVSAKTGSSIVVSLPADTVIPDGASHFLVYSKNAGGESNSPISLAITELVVVQHFATGNSHDWYWTPGGATFDADNADTEHLLLDGGTAIGLHFPSVNIPKNAQIITAYLNLHFQQISNATATISALAADNATICTSAITCDTDLSNQTTATVISDSFDNYSTGLSQTLVLNSELKPIIDELTTRSGWASGNNMTFFFSNLIGTPTTEISSYDDGGNLRPSLSITYRRTL